MKTKKIGWNPNLYKLVDSYRGQWVALTLDEKKVVGHSRKLETAVKQAKENGVDFPFVVKSPLGWVVSGPLF